MPITAQEAVMQANLLRLYHHLPDALARVIHRTVANPLAGPDTLLIVADALRGGWDDRLTQIGNAIADLAPTRKDPA